LLVTRNTYPKNFIEICQRYPGDIDEQTKAKMQILGGRNEESQ